MAWCTPAPDSAPPEALLASAAGRATAAASTVAGVPPAASAAGRGTELAVMSAQSCCRRASKKAVASATAARYSSCRCPCGSDEACVGVLQSGCFVARCLLQMYVLLMHARAEGT